MPNIMGRFFRKLILFTLRYFYCNLLLDNFISLILIAYQKMFVGNIARNVYYFQKINKVVSSVQEALEGIKDGSKILVGGFGICGVPMNLIQGVK
jgi:hypothetical protein